MRVSTVVTTITLMIMVRNGVYANDSLQTHHSFGIAVAYNGSSFTGFGGKVLLSQNTSLTFMLWLNLSSRTTDREIPGELGNQDLTSISFSIGLQQALWHFERLSLYGATAVKPAYKRVEWKSVTSESNSKEVWRQLFLYAGAGAEYSFSNQFTLSAQHLVAWSLAHYAYTYYDGRDRNVNESTLSFGETTLILTFYF